MVKAYTETEQFYKNFWAKRHYCLEPIKEIFESACLLDEAVKMHLEGRRADADWLIRKADHWKIFHWSQMLWGENNPSIHRLREDPDKPSAPPTPRSVSDVVEQSVIERDGYFCRFCRIPVILPDARKKLRNYYPDALRWGSRNTEKHSAFQAMESVLDHVDPLALGGQNDKGNLVVACQPCNNARGDNTLNELGLVNPLKDEDGLRSNDWETYWSKHYQNKALVEEWNGLQNIL